MTTSLQKTLLAVAAGLMAVAAPLASAQAAVQNRPAAAHQDDRNDRSQAQSSQAQSRNQTQNQARDQGRNDDRYGRWDSSWGARPSAPPRHFTRTSDWHRHVRACQQRYRSYNAATDRYTVRRGQTAICRL